MNMYDDEDTDEELTWKHVLYFISAVVCAVGTAVAWIVHSNPH